MELERINSVDDAGDNYYVLLSGIIRPGTREALHWSSKVEYPIEVVRLPDSEVFMYVPETYHIDKVAYFVPPFRLTSIQNRISQTSEMRFNDLKTKLFRARVFRVVADDKKPKEVTVYILARFADTWVGLKCLTLEK